MPVGPQIPGAVGRVASAGISVSHLAGFSGQLRLRYLGPRPIVEDGSVEAKRSTLFNAEASHRMARGIHLVLDVLNLFDAKASDVVYYYSSRLPGEPDAGADGIHMHPVAPRTVRIGLRVDF